MGSKTATITMEIMTPNCNFQNILRNLSFSLLREELNISDTVRIQLAERIARFCQAAGAIVDKVVIALTICKKTVSDILWVGDTTEPVKYERYRSSTKASVARMTPPEGVKFRYQDSNRNLEGGTGIRNDAKVRFYRALG